MLTLGSLFDGIGGFPLSGVMHGIKPVWASEIEPFPILVTAKRFPEMKHLGSVTGIKGDQVEPVDIITFGSPCQDLSVAGAQKGIHDGARSSLFFEAVRIIKEMREHDRATGRTGKHVRPRFAVWENVPGAYSSNKGRDFLAVLQALCEVADPDVHVPFPEGGKWQKAGCIVGEGYSVAWRTLDAQYFPRTPQRRKRIYLVADFGSERAGEILFKPHSVRGNPEEGGKEGKGTSEDAEGSAGRSCFAWTYRGRGDGCNVEMQRELGYALREPSGGGSQPNVVYPAKEQTVGDHENRVTDYTAVTVYDTTQITSPMNYSNPKPGDPCHPIAANQHPPLAVCAGNGQLHNASMQPVANSLDCMHDQQAVLTKGNPPRKYIVRRLTPLECCRLQGYPDGWTENLELYAPTKEQVDFYEAVWKKWAEINGTKPKSRKAVFKWLQAPSSDSAEYKAYGNSLAIPCSSDVLGRITAFMREETMEDETN